ncbi:LysR family transcriptional regulator [Actinoallomurus rhizosphaericola]|uniref:LysR family transcriptional regulator n=1 Tax=Actinoallomurus rhizosphaericola TaxID=2952536 RepID=UPI0020930D52|nr:LysR substrate-binding domain-containing protein [Actinoallomurus rhizosphaericola]MCO5995860.1 LysR substrate-binding domain-containing protein [Actinoallomurus rhizosphaericola]
MNVELRHLRALAAIGDEGTITGAAAVLHISQPALSRTLEQLESRLGVRLVDRTTRSLALTEAGRRLYERAHRILHQLEDALTEAATGTRPLRIGFPWAALGARTVPLLRGWREEHPGTPLEVHRCDDPEAALRRGEIDAALLRTAPVPDAGLEVRSLYRERRLAAVPEDDPLARHPSVRLTDLADRAVVLCATAATTTGLWPEGRRPRTFEVANVDEWLTVIATGDAIGVTAEATAHSHPHPGVRYLPLSDAPPVVVRLAWPRTPAHPATLALLDHLRRMAGAEEAGS